MCVKRWQNIFYWVKKKDLFGVFLDIEGDKVTMTMKTGLKEGGGIEMSTTVLPFAMLALFASNTYHVSMAWKSFDGMHFCNASAFFDSMHQHGGLVAIQLLTYAPRTTARHILIGVGHQITRWTPSTWFAVLLRTCKLKKLTLNEKSLFKNV